MLEFTSKTNYGVKYTYTAHQVAQDYAATAVQFDGNKLNESELYWKIIVDTSWLSQWWADYIKYDIPLLQSQATSEVFDKEAYDSFILNCILNYGMVV